MAKKSHTAWSWTYPNNTLEIDKLFTKKADVLLHVGQIFSIVNPKAGWKYAYRKGYRAVKVKVVRAD